MSLVVAMFFILIKRDFSNKHAIIFTSILIFSPWVVVFARNLYWIEALWFIPMLVTMYFSNKIFNSTKNYLYMLIFLYFTFLVKFLSGYEYITSIVMASFLPIIYHGLMENLNKIKLAKYIIPIGIVSILSFSTSIIIHANSISKNGNGFNHIYYTAQKRLSSNKEDAKLIAEEVCNGDKSCIEAMSNSLEANHLYVIAKYFNFKDFLPWIGSVNTNFSDEQKDYIKSILHNNELNILNKFKMLAKYTISDISMFSIINIIANKILSPLVFILLILYYIKSFKQFDTNERFFTIILFLSPISWFFLAKGHSYIHTHMNYVLWYLPTIPYLIMILYSNYVKNKND